MISSGDHKINSHFSIVIMLQGGYSIIFKSVDRNIYILIIVPNLLWVFPSLKYFLGI